MIFSAETRLPFKIIDDISPKASFSKILGAKNGMKGLLTIFESTFEKEKFVICSVDTAL